jgi:mannose-6-phosphate isomerase-like protein (cupin superfamily)
MEVQSIPVVHRDERGVTYDCDEVGWMVRKQGTVSGEHTHEHGEVFFILKGEAEVTVGHETQAVKAPAKVTVAPLLFHKIVALTDLEFLEYRY